MGIERILIRTMITLAGIFLALTLTFYPGQALFPALFLMVFITADLILPSHPKIEEKGWKKAVSKILVLLLMLAAFGCAISLSFLWKMGHFARLG